jgi:CheY-like chemotaxis protein
MRRPSALIIDDCDIVRDAVAETMALLGYEITTAADGIEGLEAFAQARHDLVLTDLTMPRMDGRELTRRLRELDPHVPIVVFSGTFTPETVEPAWETHRVAILAKPFGLDELKVAIDRAATDAAYLRTQRAA